LSALQVVFGREAPGADGRHPLAHYRGRIRHGSDDRVLRAEHGFQAVRADAGENRDDQGLAPQPGIAQRGQHGGRVVGLHAQQNQVGAGHARGVIGLDGNAERSRSGLAGGGVLVARPEAVVRDELAGKEAAQQRLPHDPGADDAERGALADYRHKIGSVLLLRHGDYLDSGDRAGGRYRLSFRIPDS
jgi:hypothetical protein